MTNMKEKTSGIYKITNKINGKCYVGCSKNIEKRWKEHSLGSQKDCIIQKSIKKYGKDNFDFNILLKCPSICFDYWEKFYIKENDSMSPNGYNLTCGGIFNIYVSSDTKQKMSESQKGKESPNKGKKFNEEWCRNISEGLKGNTRGVINKGVPKTKEHSEKISKALKGKPKSTEAIAHQRESLMKYFENRKKK